MLFYIAKKEKQANIYLEETAFSGVRKIAEKVAQDLQMVTDRAHEVQTGLPNPAQPEDAIVAATIGKSTYLEKLAKQGRVDIEKIRGKREVYLFQILEPEKGENHRTLLIAGSDKRGTIYGLFHLSELIGVSAWVWFADVVPAKKKEPVLTEKVNLISKEPSVKYRGFFINDEWPSFGNWTCKHFGGFGTQMYDRVFELLLRLKGNYLWPAMWTSSFSLDGPGLSNAMLADEYGIVMSNSHHEPCLRHSEEWDLVKGENSVYGNAWNYDRNREGLTNYWRDGLKRNGAFENIITMGMRGERDSEILGRSATLAENIAYLKEVILTQNQLIRECVNKDLEKVPRMLALYKEVEAYFYGDENTPGLKDWKELDGVTFMLCEDNFGNMRTLPDAESRNRKGGWGMYYHFDYHGDPVSYEWVNSTHLSKVWEQMTQAYEYGVRDIWIVNVGDLKPQELPLSYFLDLAYDFEKWGTDAPNQTTAYTKAWIKQQFGAFFTEEECENAYQMIEGYTVLNSIRKPEALYADTYHPVHYGEADRVLAKSSCLVETAEKLEKKYRDLPIYPAFYELLYYPTVASMNQIQMQLYAGKNMLYAKQGKIKANIYAKAVKMCIEREKTLQDGYHRVADGKWDGMMLSEHVGFVNWNDEECRYPMQCYIEPANKPRMIVSKEDAEAYTMGGDWTRKTLYADDFLNPRCEKIVLEIANGAEEPFTYQVSCDADWIQLSQTQEKVCLEEKLTLTLLKERLQKMHGRQKTSVCVQTTFAKVIVEVEAEPFTAEERADRHFVPLTQNRGLAIEADAYESSKTTAKGSFQVLKPYGKYGTGVKAFPVTAAFETDAPSLTYQLVLPEDGMYELTFLTAPLNPVSVENHLRMGIQWNEEKTEYPETIQADYRAGTVLCKEWAQGVLDNEHRLVMEKNGKKGRNTITVYACDPFVLERILVKKAGTPWEKGYIGMRNEEAYDDEKII